MSPGNPMKKIQITVIAWLLVVFIALAPLILNAHDGDTPGEDETQVNSRVLGKINFPTTTASVSAQHAFIEGMLLLHLFEYPFAKAKFQLAQELDPDFVMAYWGEAMTYNHPIWD